MKINSSHEVAITECAVYDEATVAKALNSAVDLIGGIRNFIKPGERILIKPNMLSGKPPEAAVTTHPSLVKAAIDMVRDAGATPLVGDSPGIGSARKVAERSGILDVCNKAGVELIDLKTLTVAENPLGDKFKRLEVATEALSVDGIVNVAKLKTHAQMHMTAAVKNIFGCVPGKLKPQWHLAAGVDNAHFAQMLLDLYLFLSPRLNIIDAIVSMEGNGPGNGDPRRTGLIMASSNGVALDTVAAAVLGAHHSDIPILREAIRRNMDAADINCIDIRGKSLSASIVHGFKFPPKTGTANFAAVLPQFVDKGLRKALTARPDVDPVKCTLCNICVEVCPPSVMKKTGRIEIDYDKCIRCYCCQEICPQGAISPVEGWLKRIVPGL